MSIYGPIYVICFIHVHHSAYACLVPISKWMYIDGNVIRSRLFKFHLFFHYRP